MPDNSAQVAELVDAHGSGPCAARCGGSSPLLGTTALARQEPSNEQSLAGFFVFKLFLFISFLAVAKPHHFL